MATNSYLTRVFIISNVILIFVVAFLLIHKKDTKNDLFENNLKCSKYIEQESKKIASLKSTIGVEPTIFYSPNKHTCVSAYIIVNGDLGYTGYYIEDILTNNSLYSKGARDSDQDALAQAEAGFVEMQKMLTK